MADEIYSIAAANKELSESFTQLGGGMAEAASKSKAWNVVSRMTSGSGFWKVQNKFRAVADAVSAYNENVKESIKAQSEMADTMAKLKKARDNMPAPIADEYGNVKFDNSEVMQTKEYQDAEATYKKAFGEDDYQDILLADIKEQLSINNDLVTELENKAIDDLRYSKLGWRLDKKAYFKAQKMWKFTKNLFKMATRFLVGAMFGMLLLILFLPLAIKFFKNFKGILADMGMSLGMDDIKKALTFVKDILTAVFDIFKAIFKGNVVEALKIYVERILIPIGKVIWGAAKKLPYLIFAILKALVKTIIDTVKGIINFIKGGGIKKAGGWLKKKITGRATGGIVNEDITLVGENGPELVSLPNGARVHTNSQSRRMAGNTIHVHVNGRVGASDAEIRDIAQKVAREIGLQMNRTTSARSGF
tara:strand:+ start:3132 stop:4388 length:1257 start_codon:yes stop_codon:yes gene_type:complete